MPGEPKSKDFFCAVDVDTASYSQLLTRLSGQLEGAIVSSGREALRLAEARPPILWLINPRLSDMPGLDLVEMLRQFSPQATYCVVGDTYDSDDERAARRSAVHAYLCKPLQPAWVLSLLTRKAALAARASPGFTSSLTAATKPP